MENKYKRILLKLSGEALADKQNGDIFEASNLNSVALAIKSMHDRGVEVAVVVGGGNIWRGKLAKSIGVERSTADYMGMLGTIINSLALQSALENVGVDSRVQTAIEVRQVAEPYIRRKAIRHLEKGRVVIFAAGTGNPLLASASLIGGNTLGILSQDTKALNYKYTKVGDADMIILVRKIDELQQKVVDMYYDYMTARQLYDMTTEMVEQRRQNYQNSQM